LLVDQITDLLAQDQMPRGYHCDTDTKTTCNQVGQQMAHSPVQDQTHGSRKDEPESIAAYQIDQRRNFLTLLAVEIIQTTHTEVMTQEEIYQLVSLHVLVQFQYPLEHENLS
jgi:hypothetical protein